MSRTVAVLRSCPLGAGLLSNDNESVLFIDLHNETDLEERGVSVRWKLGLLRVKPSLPSKKVKSICVTPKSRVIRVES